LWVACYGSTNKSCYHLCTEFHSYVNKRPGVL
jgi:hypothetical protein